MKNIVKQKYAEQLIADLEKAITNKEDISKIFSTAYTIARNRYKIKKEDE